MVCAITAQLQQHHLLFCAVLCCPVLSTSGSSVFIPTPLSAVGPHNTRALPAVPSGFCGRNYSCCVAVSSQLLAFCGLCSLCASQGQKRGGGCFSPPLALLGKGQVLPCHPTTSTPSLKFPPGNHSKTAHAVKLRGPMGIRNTGEGPAWIQKAGYS